MNKDFLNSEKALLTVMVQNEHPNEIIRKIRNAVPYGAEAFGVQIECLKPEFQNIDTYKRILNESQLPYYVTYYRGHNNEGKTDDQLAEGLITLAECGAELCDVMGDMFDKQPDELAVDSKAIEKQMELINTLHSKGAKVLMSSHVMKFTPAERVLEIALEQQRRGADVVKIVTNSDNLEQELENLKISLLLKEKLSVPFLFLSGGECTLHRRLGWKYGAGLILCVYEHDAFSTPTQPLLRIAKTVRDDMGFKG